MSAENAAVSVRRILAHADISDDIQLQEPALDVPHRLLDNAVRLPCTAADLIFLSRDSEKQHAFHTGIHDLLQEFIYAVQTPAILSGHRRDLFPDILPVLYKHGIDQRIRRNTGFPHHAAKQSTVSQATRPIGQIHIDTFLLIP